MRKASHLEIDFSQYAGWIVGDAAQDILQNIVAHYNAEIVSQFNQEVEDSVSVEDAA